jgi:hypothetical protein
VSAASSTTSSGAAAAESECSICRAGERERIAVGTQSVSTQWATSSAPAVCMHLAVWIFAADGGSTAAWTYRAGTLLCVEQHQCWDEPDVAADLRLRPGGVYDPTTENLLASFNGRKGTGTARSQRMVESRFGRARTLSDHRRVEYLALRSRARGSPSAVVRSVRSSVYCPYLSFQYVAHRLFARRASLTAARASHNDLFLFLNSCLRA